MSLVRRLTRPKLFIPLLAVILSVAILGVLREIIVAFHPSASLVVDIVIKIIEYGVLLISIVVALMQLRDSKKLSYVTFLTELNKSYVENPDYITVYRAMQACIDDTCEYRDQCQGKCDCKVPMDKSLISNYLTFFETVHILIDEKIISFRILNDLFAYRFFMAVHSSLFQREKLARQPRNFANIFKLEHRWLQYRAEQGLDTTPGTVYNSRTLEDAVGSALYNDIIGDNR